MSEHKHGSMDITPQQKAFAGFIRVAGFSAAVVIVILIFLAIVGT
jgi:hypothetical protein